MNRFRAREVLRTLGKLCLLAAASTPATAQLGHVVDAQKISDTSGGFTALLEEQDQFGRSIVNLGDLDGDGVTDLLVGAHTDDDGGLDQGSVYVLFLHPNGFVKAWQKISDLYGNFSGYLGPGDQFGRAAANLGDLDGDGVVDVAVSANYDDDDGANKGAVYILFLNADGTVKAAQKISALSGGFSTPLNIHDEFGRSLTSLGDLDGDGVTDLLVGTPEDDGGGTNTGALHVLFLDTDGTVKSTRKINKANDGLRTKPGDWFGFCTANLGDFDGDGVVDVAAGSVLDDDGGVNQGSFWLLYLRPDGSVKEAHEISEIEGGFTAPLDDIDQFGTSVVNLGDLDGDGVTDVAVGAVKDDDGGPPGDPDADVGAVHVLFLNADATVKSQVKISDTSGDLFHPLDSGDWFGSALARLGGSPGDGTFNLAIGCRYDNDGGGNHGAIYLVQLNDGTFPAAEFSADRTLGVAPLTVQFSDLSTGDVTAWQWNFSDGPLSTQQHTVKTFATPGSYDVQLTVRGPEGSDALVKRDLVTVVLGPLADFDAAPSSGSWPLSVAFSDLSQGTVTGHAWDFGDGGTSSAAAPVHVYTAAGSYTVSLTVSGPDGTHTETRSGFVDVTEPPPVADFSADPTSGDVPLAVTFLSDATLGASAFAWDFGDGTSSTEADPIHVYSAPGVFSVTLSVTGPSGSDSLTRSDLIRASAPAPVADFTADPTLGATPLTVVFTDASQGSVTSWSWDFGDGQASAERDPVHVYSQAGTYTVALTASGPGGSDTRFAVDLIQAELAPPGAAFLAQPTSGFAPLAVAFSDASTLDVTSWSWSFGDGETSSASDPVHVYAAPGSYFVALTVAGPGGADTLAIANLITVAPAPTVADFELSPASGAVPLAVVFTDLSSADVSAWSWDFGDGTGSSAASPSHVYAGVGVYDVSLSVTSATGADVRTRSACVTVLEPAPVAAIGALPTTGLAPLAVFFSDLSTGAVTSWSWSFGDGASSTLQAPQHVYDVPGTYTVALTASGPGGSDVSAAVDLVTVLWPAPVASFDAAPRAGPVPLSVSFDDQTTGNVGGWLWDFGDGTSSTDMDPRHVYSEPGVYSVSLTVTGAGGTHTLTRTDLITAEEVPLAADFGAAPTLGTAPLAVQFADASTGVITGWLWDFGDGATSTLASPQHEYTVPGTYTVGLCVTGPDGKHATARSDLVTVGWPAPAADFAAAPTAGVFPLSVQFTDASSGAVTAWLWDFGDGATSTLASPQHVFADPGLYTVSLTATGPGGASTATQADLVRVTPPPPVAGFAASGSQGIAPLSVSFNDLSSGAVTGWSWDFGDGATSDLADPQHVYTEPGVYTVSLTATGPGGASTATQADLVRVAPPAPVAGFAASGPQGIAPLGVAFTDLSSGVVTGWSWDFGDGATSAQADPQHVYVDPGVFTVSLTATGPGGSSSATQVDLVRVTPPPPVADFTATPREGYAPLIVSFTDLTGGAVTSWSWDFGDGATSDLTHPVHVFDLPGSFSVALTASGPGGADVQRRTILVRPVPPGFADGSFEQQAAGLAPGTPWIVLAGSALVNPTLVSSDNGLPSHGERWCEIGAEGTAHATPPSNPGGAGTAPQGAAGVLQDFLFDPRSPHLFFDAVFLLSGSARSASRNDFMSVDLSTESASWNVFYADTFSDFPLRSDKLGLPMTAVSRVHVDVGALFPGADESTVLRLRVSVGNGGNGANPSRAYVDDFHFVQAATALFRNGSGLNPAFYTSSPAVLGGQWTVEIDSAGQPGARLSAVAVHLAPAAGVFRAAGEVLVGGPRLYSLAFPSSGALDRRVLPVPLDTSLAGISAATQAFLIGQGLRLGNAYDLTLGF